jgi:apolipoprotein N-acyltransferase
VYESDRPLMTLAAGAARIPVFMRTSPVRAAASGLSAAFDPWDRVLGMSDDFAEGDTTMTAQVPMGRVRTPYSRTGDWFPWSCVVATAIMLAIAATPYLRGR